MRYMMQVRFNGADAVIHRLPAAEQDKITAEFQAVGQLKGVLDGHQLEGGSTAKTVRVQDGQTMVSAGPAVDLDAAISFAARIPVARMGGTVEVRALMER
jgi:hypothetical protein